MNSCKLNPRRGLYGSSLYLVSIWVNSNVARVRLRCIVGAFTSLQKAQNSESDMTCIAFDNAAYELKIQQIFSKCLNIMALHSVATSKKPGRSPSFIASHVILKAETSWPVVSSPSSSGSGRPIRPEARHSAKDKRLCRLTHDVREYLITRRASRRSGDCTHSIASSTSSPSRIFSLVNGLLLTREIATSSPTSTHTCSPFFSSSLIRPVLLMHSRLSDRILFGVSSALKVLPYDAMSVRYLCTVVMASQKTRCFPSPHWIGITFSRRWTWMTIRCALPESEGGAAGLSLTPMKPR
mmetsp:Transcript_21778/g.66108  ORF Transcript_21778/g.66108 Transcript_21778/m.66108 type:complete len:296 (-) Transcript_21778:161-1048(-)